MGRWWEVSISAAVGGFCRGWALKVQEQADEGGQDREGRGGNESPNYLLRMRYRQPATVQANWRRDSRPVS